MSEETKEIVNDFVVDITNPDVVTKYKAAGAIANAAVQHVASLCKPGALVVELCQKGDDYIADRVGKVYNKGKITKGVAFPTCVSVNSIVGHFSPIASDKSKLKDGDTIKLDLGCHIDGYAAVVATTIIMGDTAKVEGKAADVMMAAHTAGELVLRMLKPDADTKTIGDMVALVAEQFGVKCVMGVCSHDMKRFIIDGEKVIIPHTDPEQKTEQKQLEPNEVYVVDVVMTTGDGKPKESTDKTTIYMRNAEGQYKLKMKASRYVLNEIKDKHPYFPFSVRAFGDEAAKVNMGIKECVSHNMVNSYPVLGETPGEHVAHLKFTALLMPNGALKVTGVPLDLARLHSDKKVVDEELLKILATSVGKKKKKNKKK